MPIVLPPVCGVGLSFPFCLGAHPLGCHCGSCVGAAGPAGDGRLSPRWLAASSSCQAAPSCSSAAERRLVSGFLWAPGVSAGVSIVLGERLREAFVSLSSWKEFVHFDAVALL